jgi:hypothetical protein
LKTALARFIQDWDDGSSDLPVSYLPPLRRLARRLSSKQLDGLAAEYDDGATAAELAAVVGVAKSALLKLFRERGVRIRTRRSLTEAEIDEPYGSARAVCYCGRLANGSLSAGTMCGWPSSGAASYFVLGSALGYQDDASQGPEVGSDFTTGKRHQTALLSAVHASPSVGCRFEALSRRSLRVPDVDERTSLPKGGSCDSTGDHDQSDPND